MGDAKSQTVKTIAAATLLLDECRTTLLCFVAKKLDGVAPLIADPPPVTPPLCTVGWSAKTEIFVLTVQPICPVRQIGHNL